MQSHEGNGDDITPTPKAITDVKDSFVTTTTSVNSRLDAVLNALVMGASDKTNPGSEVTNKFPNSAEGTVNAKLTAILNAIVYQAGISKTPVKDVTDNLGDTENKTLLAILNAFVSFND